MKFYLYFLWKTLVVIRIPVHLFVDFVFILFCSMRGYYSNKLRIHTEIFSVNLLSLIDGGLAHVLIWIVLVVTCEMKLFVLRGLFGNTGWTESSWDLEWFWRVRLHLSMDAHCAILAGLSCIIANRTCAMTKKNEIISTSLLLKKCSSAWGMDGERLPRTSFSRFSHSERWTIVTRPVHHALQFQV